MKASLSPPAPSEEDGHLVKAYLLHVVLLDALEQDVRLIGTVPLKMAQLYIRALSSIQDQIMASLTSIRREMKARGIRVYEETRTAKGIEASYLCRGYQRRFAMLWTYVQAESGLVLSRYLGIRLPDA